MASSLIVRAISGAVLAAVMVGMTLAWYDPADSGFAAAGWTFYLLWTVVGGLTLWEYCGLLRKHLDPSSAGSKAAWYAGGTIYILQAVWLILLMNPMMVVTLLTVVWMADTGAYLIGSSIGKHKMAPVISPKKSWEGFYGGLLFGVSVALVWYALFWRHADDGGRMLWGDAVYQGQHVWMALRWAGFGLLVALAATGGDLLESRFKRKIGVKDSGSIIPGHGGMLDRFDALLLAAPVAWLYIWLTELV